MSNSSITGNIFSKSGSFQQLLLLKKQIFYAPVLISKLNLKVHNLLTITNKAEMTGFNNSCMDGTDTNLVQLFAFDFVKWVVSDDLTLIEPVIRIS